MQDPVEHYHVDPLVDPGGLLRRHRGVRRAPALGEGRAVDLLSEIPSSSDSPFTLPRGSSSLASPAALRSSPPPPPTGREAGVQPRALALEASVAIVVCKVLGTGEPGDPRVGGRVRRDPAARRAGSVHDQCRHLPARRRLGLEGAEGLGDRGCRSGDRQHEPRPRRRAGARAECAGRVALFVVAAILFIAYAHTALGHGHARLERLYGFASEVGRTVHATSVQETILAHARSAVDAERRPRPRRRAAPTRSPASSSAIGVRSPPAHDAADPTAWWSPAVAGQTVLLTGSRGSIARRGGGRGRALRRGPPRRRVDLHGRRRAAARDARAPRPAVARSHRPGRAAP